MAASGRVRHFSPADPECRIPRALSHLLPTTLALFTPQSGGSPNADEIDSLYKIILYIALVIFVGVEGALGYALYHFRARKGAVAAQIRGNTRLELGWTAGAALIVIVLAIITFLKLDAIQNPANSGPGGDALAGENGQLFATADRRLPPNGKSLEITIIGRQYLWQYIYPGASNPDGLGAPYSYEEMVVPTKTTVTLNIVSSDVVHSWWIPRPREASSRPSPATTTTRGSRSKSPASSAASARTCAAAGTPA